MNKGSLQNMARTTQGDYRFRNKIAGSKKRIKKLVSPQVWKVLEKYENAMVIESLSDAAQAKNYDMILSLTRMLPKDKNWLELDKDDVERQVVIIMKRHSDNGKETNTTSDHKRFLKIWFRFLKLGSRKFKKVGDPIETRDIVSKSIDSKITRLQLISPDEKKKLVDACGNFRDKALIHVHYDAGTRIGEILSIQIKHLKHDKNGYVLSVDGKTGSRNIRILESIPTLARWLESHPEKDNPEAYLFCSMKSIWTGNKLSYQGSVRVLNTACKRAGIRHLNWHLFRHTEATRTAKYMSDGITKKRHGWSPTSKMPARYSHINNADVDEAFLKHHGIQPDELDEENTLPVMCKICNTPNSHDTTICQTCGKPLTMQQAILLEDESQKAVKSQNEKIQFLEKQNLESQSLMKELLEGQQKLVQQMQGNTAQQNKVSSEIGKSNNPLINEVWNMVPAEWTKGMTRPPINTKIIAAREKLAMLQSTGF